MAVRHFTDLDMMGNRILHTPDAFATETLTLEEYELKKANHEIDENTFYIITDDVTGAPPIIRLSKAEYQTLVDEGRINPEAFYFIYDDSDPFIDDTVVSTNKAFSSKHMLECLADMVDEAIGDEVEPVVEAKARDIIEEKMEAYLQVLEVGTF